MGRWWADDVIQNGHPEIGILRENGVNTVPIGAMFPSVTSNGIGYRNWYQDWGHCGVTNDLGSSPQPEGEARGLWWASQVVGDTTMTEIEVSISILSWCPKAY